MSEEPSSSPRANIDSVSVVIPTRDRRCRVLQLVDNLRSQSRVPDEIIVVDGNPGHGLGDQLKDDSLVQYVPSWDDEGASHARNEGMHRSRGEVCVLMDDDVVPEPDFISDLLQAYSSYPDIGGAGGHLVESPPPSRYRVILWRMFRRGPFAHPMRQWSFDPSDTPHIVHRLNCGVASFRREILERFSFDENLVRSSRGEDKDFCWRVSRDHDLLYVPSARAHHEELGWGQRNLTDRFQNKILSHAYHYYKNLRGNPRWSFAFAWLMIGIMGEAVVYSVARGTVEPIRGVARAMKAISSSMAGAGGFIRKDPRDIEDNP